MKASEFEREFLAWTGPRERESSPYQPYWKMLTSLPDRRSFWEDFAREAGTLEAERFGMLRWLFMGMVQLLALGPDGLPLARHLPNAPCYDDSADSDDSGRVFHEFCRLCWDDIWSGVRTRHVQINKVGRNAIFVPLFHKARKWFTEEPVFIEVGSSVGFGLLWPFIRYDWGCHGITQPSEMNTNVTVSCDLQGKVPPYLPDLLATPRNLYGIEIHPLDLRNPDDCRWLQALVAPGDRSGLRLLNAGLDLAAAVQPKIVTGCAAERITSIAAGTPDRPLFVYHSMTEHHLRAQQKLDQFRRTLRDLSAMRQVVEFGVEWRREPGNPVEVFVTRWSPAGGDEQLVGFTDPSANGSYLRFV